ncbi:MAG: oxygenase MpaB family protein [Actinomycetes bacterium]
MTALFSPDSIAWRIHSDESMLVGGIRALLVQALHPEAMAGVAINSNFREDTWGRFRRTSEYVSLLTFGESEVARKSAARVRAVHAKLRVDDPVLLLWVHMAMVDSFLDTALRSGLSLTQDEQNQYLAEMVTFAELVGLDRNLVPATLSELQAYFERMQPHLFASDDAKRAALFLTFPPMAPWIRFATPAAPTWSAVAALASSSLPSWARQRYGLISFPGHQTRTDIGLKTLRRTLKLLPPSLRENPYRVASEKVEA